MKIIKGYKVLNIDIDPQGNTTSGLGFDKSSIDKSIYDILCSDSDIDQVMKKSELVDNFYMIPSTMELAGAEVELINVNNRESILKDKIKSMKQ